MRDHRTRRWRRPLLYALVSLVLGASIWRLTSRPGVSSAAGYGSTVTTSAVATERIVTLGGSVTEIVFALGAGDRVVGVDKSSHIPASVDTLAQVGNFRSVSAEGVLSLTPTLVIATDDAGPPPALAQIRAAGVALHLVPTAETVADTEAKILEVAAALGLPEAGQALADKVVADVRAASEVAARMESSPRVLFIYARGAGTLLVSGTGTAADEILRLAGAVNAVTSFEGYRPLTAEAVVAAAPDLILIPELGFESLGGAKGLRALPGINITPAGRAGRFVTLDDALLLGFGPRLGVAILDLAHRLHQDPLSFASPLPNE